MSLTLREQLLPFARGTQKACAKKLKYETEEAALRVIDKRVKGNLNPETEPLYAYRCQHCCGWHITKLKPKTGETNGNY